MNYLRISNAGLICAEDLTLIGSSTKREQTGKIGMFGSGWKYALAWLLRNECNPVIFAGKKQIVVDTKVKLHRDNPVNVITVDEIETSLTTEMGPKWSGWMAIREILSNAIDEGSHTVSTNWSPQMEGVENQTVIYLPMNGELSEVMMKYDKYFAFNRKENYTNKHGRIFVKKEPSEQNIYRRGIRCYDTSDISYLDFDFNDISINEDRLCASYNITQQIRYMIEDIDDTNLLKLLLTDCEVECQPWDMNTNVLERIKELINAGVNFTTSTLVKLGGEFLSGKDPVFIRAEWYKKLQDLGLVKNPFEMFGDDEAFMRTDAKDLNGVKYFLDGLGINITLQSGKTDRSQVLFKNGIGFVRDDSKYGDRELASMILGKMKADDFLHYLK